MEAKKVTVSSIPGCFNMLQVSNINEVLFFPWFGGRSFGFALVSADDKIYDKIIYTTLGWHKHANTMCSDAGTCAI
jgi:hypothetical protein